MAASTGKNAAPALIKAQAVLTDMAVLKDMLGADFPAYLQSLDPAVRDVFLRPPIATTWLPLAHSMAMLELGLSRLGGGLPQYFEFARRTIHHDMTRVYRTLLRFTPVRFLANRANTIWQTYYRNNGHVVVERSADSTAELAYLGIRYPSAWYWELVRGGQQAVLEFARVKQVEMRIVDGGGDSPDCRMIIRWS